MGSAVTDSADGDVVAVPLVGLTLSQETFVCDGEKGTEPLELVTLMVCDTGAPPACVEKANVGLSTLNV